MRAPVPVASALLALLLLLAPSASAHGPFVETDPAADLGLFPTPDEVQTLYGHAAEHPWATLHEISASESGRPLRVLEITNPDSSTPVEERVVTLILTQQHGNEPAGTGAAVQLLDDFASETTVGSVFGDTLDDQVLLLLVMANPDGADANARRNANDVDINRDHVALETAEARAIHAVLQRWDVHVAMDHHEYGGTGLGNPSPVRVYDYDLTTLFPNHGNVRAPTRAASEQLMYDAIWPAAEAAGYTVNEYGEQTVAGVPVQQLAGGPDPGIMRNNIGLNNVAGLLIETRIDAYDNPFHDAQRRIDIQRLVMEATLEHVAANAQAFIEAKRESERLNLEEPPATYEEGERTGPMPAAFHTQVDLDALFALHGLEPGFTAEGGGRVYATHDPRLGLIAAMLHPESSRAVAAAEPLAEPDAGEELVEPASAPQANVPLGGALPLLALGLLALALRRR